MSFRVACGWFLGSAVAGVANRCPPTAIIAHGVEIEMRLAFLVNKTSSTTEFARLTSRVCGHRTREDER
jgi:hypothetical protein